MTISVVIPTIGNRDISKTINSINHNDFKVDEILVCTVRNSKIKTLKRKNVKIIFCKEKGQVKQRIEGFKLAKGDYILQLDDDIILNKNCIRLLFDELKNLPNASISPNVFLSENKNSIFGNKDSLKQKIFNLISGLKLYNREGRITISGLPAISTYSFNSDKALHYKTLITQEMLAKGFLASTNFYASVAHNVDNLSLYFGALAEVYELISECEKGDEKIQHLLKGPVCHSGFKRLN